MLCTKQGQADEPGKHIPAALPSLSPYLGLANGCCCITFSLAILYALLTHQQ